MEIPNNILSIVDKINQSEDRWKALYMGTWGFSYQIKAKYENTPYWDKEIPFGLPASKNKNHIYTPHRLHSILTSRDGEFTLGCLQNLFSLFEDLLNEASKILCSSEFDTSKWPNMKKFFEETDTRDILTDSQIKELKLAKETRNCYIHNGSKIDQRWLDSYEDAKGSPIASVGDDLRRGFPNLFHQIEEWQILIVDTTNSIKDKIETK